jgi:acetylornithine deacetylase/succinyl-diaminopimelate desuccinylase-like protein
MRAMEAQVAARLIHSADERIPVDDLELAVRCFRHVAVELTGSR